jgi:hypothetical protein
VNALRREWGTHLHADESDWEFPASFGDVMSMAIANGFYTVHRDPKSPQSGNPFPAPWGDGRPRFTPEEIEIAEQRLAARSAIR